MIDIIFAAVQTWPFWGQAAFLLTLVFIPSCFVIVIAAEVVEAIETRRIRRAGRRWRKW
jgi:hypothetical protein